MAKGSLCVAMPYVLVSFNKANDGYDLLWVAVIDYFNKTKPLRLQVNCNYIA